MASGVEREPGQTHTCRTPAAASSSTNVADRGASASAADSVITASTPSAATHRPQLPAPTRRTRSPGPSRRRCRSRRTASPSSPRSSAERSPTTNSPSPRASTQPIGAGVPAPIQPFALANQLQRGAARVAADGRRRMQRVDQIEHAAPVATWRANRREQVLHVGQLAWTRGSALGDHARRRPSAPARRAARRRRRRARCAPSGSCSSRVGEARLRRAWRRAATEPASAIVGRGAVVQARPGARAWRRGSTTSPWRDGEDRAGRVARAGQRRAAPRSSAALHADLRGARRQHDFAQSSVGRPSRMPRATVADQRLASRRGRAPSARCPVAGFDGGRGLRVLGPTLTWSSATCSSSSRIVERAVRAARAGRRRSHPTVASRARSGSKLKPPSNRGPARRGPIDDRRRRADARHVSSRRARAEPIERSARCPMPTTASPVAGRIQSARLVGRAGRGERSRCGSTARRGVCC